MVPICNSKSSPIYIQYIQPRDADLLESDFTFEMSRVELSDLPLFRRDKSLFASI